MISQAAALPTQVEMPSTVWRIFWTSMRRRGREGEARRPFSKRGAARFGGASDLLRGRVLAEIVIERHAAVDDGVLLPPGRPLREGELGLEDLLEERVLGRLLLHDLVIDLEL